MRLLAMPMLRIGASNEPLESDAPSSRHHGETPRRLKAMYSTRCSGSTPIQRDTVYGQRLKTENVAKPYVSGLFDLTMIC